jgi:hypothetical protein
MSALEEIMGFLSAGADIVRQRMAALGQCKGSDFGC